MARPEKKGNILSSLIHLQREKITNLIVKNPHTKVQILFYLEEDAELFKAYWNERGSDERWNNWQQYVKSGTDLPDLYYYQFLGKRKPVACLAFVNLDNLMAGAPSVDLSSCGHHNWLPVPC